MKFRHVVFFLTVLFLVSSGVMVFKQRVDDRYQELRRLQSSLVEAKHRYDFLRAQEAFYLRPEYLLPLASQLGLEPVRPNQLASIDDLGNRERWRWQQRVLTVDLPSGETVPLALRPRAGGQVAERP